MISEFMLAILQKVRANYPYALLLDAPPAIYDSIDTPYIVSPGDGEVSITHMISNSSQCDFTAHIYLGNHIPNANRQTDISENIIDVLKQAEEIYRTCFPRYTKSGDSGLTISYTDPISGQKIAAVNDTTDYSTTTWVVSGKVYAVVSINLHFKSYVDY